MASRLSLLLLVVCSLAVAQAQLELYNLHATNLPSDIFGITDAYIKAFCGTVNLGTTAVRHNNKNPWWEERFIYSQATSGNVITLEVFDEDMVFDDLVGRCTEQLTMGSHDVECRLAEGGSLHYSYRLGPQ